MTRPEQLTATELRRVAVHASGLGRAAPFGRGRAAIQRAVEHLGHVQIDTISVVARAHDHILASRVPGYRSQQLQDLLQRRAVFEYWAHAAAFLPMQDYRHALPRMQRLAASRQQRSGNDVAMRQMVLARIEAEGALRARDFEAPPGHRSGWWSWKPAKLALERLFHEGRLMVSARDGFEKCFDLSERVLPIGVDTRPPTLAQHADWLLQRTGQALGVFSARHVRYQRRESGLAAAVTAALDRAEERGEILRVQNKVLPASRRWYADRGALEAGSGRLSQRLQALSPFDPVLIHRDRLAALFGFDYQIECYLPAVRRRYGYFSLPLLQGSRFVGRADCKAERSEGLLRCRHLALEANAAGTDPEALRRGLVELAQMNGCERLAVAKISGCDEASARRLRKALSAP